MCIRGSCSSSTMMYTSLPIAVGLSVIALFIALKLYRTQISIRMIRGPPSPSWLLGHQYMLRHAKNLGDYEVAWYREYGSIFRIAGVLNEPVLLVSDPKALQYILQTSGYRFPKSLDTSRQLAAFVGYGLAAAIGQDHKRQRKILNAAFSATHLQSYLAVIHAIGFKLVHGLKDSVEEGHEIQNMLLWTQKATLDIIGITSFRYSFGALDNTHSASEDSSSRQLFVRVNVKEKSDEYLPLPNAEALLFPSKADVVISHGLLRYLPQSIMPMIIKLPTRENMMHQEFKKAMEDIARNIYHLQLQSVKDGIRDEGKDIINILAHSTLSDDEGKRMTETEIAAQLGTFIFAGHEVPAHVLAWLLYELSRHPEDQDKIRQEISRIRPDTGALTSSDYDAMHWLNASIKETLRLHPFAHTLVRVPEHDDVLPLLEPITTRDGKVLEEIPIAKGQPIHISIYLYNRNTIVWGKDAPEWNPKRFFEDKHRQTSLGMYANLLSFSSGARSCIGWRFAIMELQALTVELLSTFAFSIPKDSPAIVHGPGSQIMFPLLAGRPEEGAQMPLHVSILKKEA